MANYKSMVDHKFNLRDGRIVEIMLWSPLVTKDYSPRYSVRIDGRRRGRRELVPSPFSYESIEEAVRRKYEKPDSE